MTKLVILNLQELSIVKLFVQLSQKFVKFCVVANKYYDVINKYIFLLK